MQLKKLFKLGLVIFALVLAFGGCADSEEQENIEIPEESEEIIEEAEEFTEDYYDRLFMGDVVTDETKRENIFSALTEIKMNTEFIKDFQKVESTDEGEKYSFTYRDTEFTVVMESDSEIASVKVGEDGADVYLKGYEAYDAEDYIFTESMKDGMKHMVDNAVEVSLDYPENFEYAGDWSFRHEENFYYISVTVLTGTEKTAHPLILTCYYDAAENTMHWYKLVVDGKDISIPLDFEVIQKAERQKISD